MEGSARTREKRRVSAVRYKKERIGWRVHTQKITTTITPVLILSHSGQYSFYPTQDHSHPLLSHTLLPQHTATVTTATVTPHLNDSSNRGRVVIQGASAVSGLHGNTSGSTEAL